MSSGDIERLKTKLFALNMRVAEVRSELAQAQARVCALEQRLEDAKLAALLGEEAGNPSEIGPELETSRTAVADHEQLLRSLHSSQWETRLRYLIARRREIEADKAEQEKQ